MNDYISATEFCAKLGISRMTLHRWERDASVNLPDPVRIKGKRFFALPEVNAFLAGHREQSEVSQ